MVKKYPVILILILLGAFSLMAQVPDSTTITAVGNSVPDFSVTTLDGEVFSPSALKGNVLLINFFATWCPPCREEYPALEKKVWQVFKSQQFKLISIGREHQPDELKSFKKEMEVSFRMAADPARQIYGKFATSYIPRNILVDKEGVIMWQGVGYSEEEFQSCIRKIEELLAE